MIYEEAIEYITERYVTMSMCLTLDECRKHNKAISMAIEALEKQIQKKPIEKYTDYDSTEAGLCPFCGNTNITGATHKPVGSAEFYEVLCVECGARIRRSSKRKAIEAWNRRCKL